MGEKQMESVNDRLHNAFDAAWRWQSEHHQSLMLLAGEKGVNQIYMHPSFVVYDDQPVLRIRPELIASAHGQFHGLLFDCPVYQPQQFNPHIIEFRDETGEFIYTIDLEGQG